MKDDLLGRYQVVSSWKIYNLGKSESISEVEKELVYFQWIIVAVNTRSIPVDIWKVKISSNPYNIIRK